MAIKRERDPVSGQWTTGHEWSGLKELDTAVPLVVKAAFGIVGVWALVYWVLYPAFPTPGLTDNTGGVLGYSSREAVDRSVALAREAEADWRQSLLDADLDDLVRQGGDLSPYLVGADVLFRENCGVCHGWDGKGQVGDPAGFPSLHKEVWLWDGTPTGIYEVLLYGINGDHPDAFYAQMSAYLRDGLLERAEIDDAVEHVLSISGQAHDPDRATRGAEVFAGNCAACHGEQGEGGLGNGAPSLIDENWIYGGDRQTLRRTIYYGRQGWMPHWSDRLDDVAIRQLALYTHQFGGGTAPDAE